MPSKAPINHGMTGVSLAATSNSGHKDGIGSLVPGFQFLPFPYKFRNPFGYQEEGIDEFAANNLKRVLDDIHSGCSKPAAVILGAVHAREER